MAANTPPPKPTYPAFTSQALGEGLFDQLMLTMKGHIHEEYAQQRITSADYARVFLGTMEAALSNTTQFLMAGLLLELQKQKIEAEIRLIDLEGEKLRYEIDYMYPAQLIKLQQEGLLIEAQVRLAEAQILKTAAEIEKIHAEIALLVLQEALIAAQILKIEKEIEFLTAKIATEWANTTEGFLPGSVIGRQTTLLRAQQLGFAGELHLKVAKLSADYQSVYESVNEAGIDHLPTGPSDATGALAKGVANTIEALG
jgi:hypothetical protein